MSISLISVLKIILGFLLLLGSIWVLARRSPGMFYICLAGLLYGINLILANYRLLVVNNQNLYYMPIFEIQNLTPALIVNLSIGVFLFLTIVFRTRH